ncbi:MAG: isochorismatase family protein [Alphaproteobacteria bacterium]|nr:isochorismatase family protein [Alphaproteobacteria bacterium]
MPLTTLDPKTALVVIDLQTGIAALPGVHPIADIAKKAGALAAVFRRHGLPVVLVNVTGGAPGRTEQQRRLGELPQGWADLLPELDQQPSDLTVTKKTWGAFPGTDLEAQLRQAGVTQIVLCGVATSIGVESTAREAYALGFNVSLALDAMTDLSAEAHANSVERIFPRLGETGVVADFITLLDQRSV